MAVYLHLLLGLNSELILNNVRLYIYYVLCLPIYTYLYTT